MWAEVNGERKKVACGPCIRGHRSSKCDHRDRVLVEVRKPGRPLSSCPHPTGSCSCERVVINYTIPKTSECACPSDQALPTPVSNSSGRVQKNRNRKSSVLNPAVLEKAIKASRDVETDASSVPTQTPTSESNNASAPSSASSTPHMLPSRKESTSSDLPTIEPAVSSCCQPKPKPAQPEAGGCCSGKRKEQIKPAPPKKSCCSGSEPAQPPQPQVLPNGPTHPAQAYPGFPQRSGQFQHAQYGMVNQGNNYMQMHPPLNFNTPIYNHVASGYHPPPSMPMASMNGHTHALSHNHAPEHNCHCGDSCSCFGCAAHPSNATMIEYVRSMHQFMSTGQLGAFPAPSYDMPLYPHHPGYGAETIQAFNNHAPGNFVPTNQMSFQAKLANAMSISHTPLNLSSPWSQNSSQAHTPAPTSSSIEPQYATNTANDSTPTTTQEPVFAPKTEEPTQSPVFTDSPSEGKEEDAVTLSPSSYFWQEMVLPGCNDATGTCQCGDGCECVGCLTHGGHNGVPLNISTTSGHEPFPDYISPTSLSSDIANHFMPFSNAPT